ncbi:hypothetical protein D9M68_770240 [compost metagenome]
MDAWIALLNMQKGFGLEVTQQAVLCRVRNLQHVTAFCTPQMEIVVALTDQALNAYGAHPEEVGRNLTRFLRADVSSLRGQACVEVARLVQVAHGGGLKNL